jgi:hypothetical protein
LCDYSLQAVKSRPAKVGDKLVTKNFGTGTTGFCDISDEETAVCCLPGSELSFESPVTIAADFYCGAEPTTTQHCVAVFAQVSKEIVHTHHDQVQFPDGTSAMLNRLVVGQHATVLQLPATPTTEKEREDQTRAVYAG